MINYQSKKIKNSLKKNNKKFQIKIAKAKKIV